MPPTVRFTRDAVLHAACQLMRREGMEALNARAIAKELGGSASGIFICVPVSRFPACSPTWRICAGS